MPSRIESMIIHHFHRIYANLPLDFTRPMIKEEWKLLLKTLRHEDLIERLKYDGRIVLDRIDKKTGKKYYQYRITLKRWEKILDDFK